jgi:hypothetical protein
MKLRRATIQRVLTLRAELDGRGEPLHTYREIAKRLGISENQARRTWYYYKRESLPQVKISADSLPLQTRGGSLWHWPPYGHDSDVPSLSCSPECPFWNECKVAVMMGDFVACESPIPREMLS